MPPARTGYAPVNGLQMYYEIHGGGGTPLLLLHGGLFNIDLQFGELIPGLAATRQVIAVDFQGHGRTNDIDRPLRSADLASDVVGVLRHLDVARADVFGFSVGGAGALHLAVKHPELFGKLIVSSVSFHPDGDRAVPTIARVLRRTSLRDSGSVSFESQLTAVRRMPALRGST
jgi:pimeloyl-ACP methyl ester carboxylesterase